MFPAAGATLPAVVATSSLELGIDMGAVDLVIQVESPGAVSRGLQQFTGRKFEYEPKNEFEERYAHYPTETVERIRNQVLWDRLIALLRGDVDDIADVQVAGEPPVLLDDRAGRLVEIGREDFGYFGRRQGLGHFGEAFQIGEHHEDLALFAVQLQRVGVFHDFGGYIARQVFAQGALGKAPLFRT